MTEAKAQVLQIGGKANQHGDTFAPGCLKGDVTVPVTLGFDSSVIIGEAVVHEDGSATLKLEPETGGLLPGSDVGIGFTVERWREEGDVRVLEELRPVCLGASVANRGFERQTCPSCKASRLITVRSVDGTFWCQSCKAWKPCAPKEGPRGYSSSS